MNIGTILLLLCTVAALVWSFFKDKKKTIIGLKAAGGRLLQTGSQILGIMALIGMFLTVVPEGAIKSVLGRSSQFLSAVYGAVIGTVTIIPAFIAFPLSASLVESGAHIIAVATFITTLTMVGFATMPVEIKYFGKRFTYVRNLLSFVAALVIGLGMGVILL